MEATLQPLAEEHRKPVIDIYNHYVEHGFASYREVPLPYEAFDRFLSITRGFPAYACVAADGTVAGFGFLHPWHPSECCKRTGELTYFLRAEATGQGIGSRLLARLLAEAVPLGLDRVLASVSSRNPGSLAFHRRHGFEECGRFPQVGRKHGEDFDVVWMIRKL